MAVALIQPLAQKTRARRRPQPGRTAPAARLSDADLPPLDQTSPRWPGRVVRVGNAEVFVRRTPGPEGAEPALLVHGLGGSSTNWTDLAQQLASRLSVEAIDLPGFGRAGPSPTNDYSVQTQAATVIKYLENSARGRVHLVGNSMGGLISLLVAAQRPDLIRTLSVISPAVPDVKKLRAHPLKANPRAGFALVPGLGEYGVMQMSRLPVEKRVKGTIALCFYDRERYPDTRLQQDVQDTIARAGQPWANPAFLRATRQLVHTWYFRGRSVWDTIRTVQAPTLVLWGDDDKLVAHDLAHALADAVPVSRVLVLANIGHTAMMEDPVTTARAILGQIEDATR